MYQDIINLITNIGFPIACVIFLAMYTKSITERLFSITEKCTSAIDENTNTIKRLIDRLDREGEE